jgi:hypothetical protein
LKQNLETQNKQVFLLSLGPQHNFSTTHSFFIISQHSNSLSACYIQGHCRVARWHIFKTKIPIWVDLEGLAMEDVGILYVHFAYFPGIFVHFMAIWCTYFMAIWYFFQFWYVVP